jgi:putative FmdB family regulatory protein
MPCSSHVVPSSVLVIFMKSLCEMISGGVVGFEEVHCRLIWKPAIDFVIMAKPNHSFRGETTVPIYEFYCADCHMVFNFFSSSVNTTKRPACPRCLRPKLERQISRFAVFRDSSGGSEEDGLPPGFDEAKMAQTMEALAREADGINEDDPRQAAQVLRKLFESTGMPLSEGMQEAMRRMEAGEDPDKIEEEMGDVFSEEDLFASGGSGKLRDLSKKLKPPAVDDTLYDL